jgi:hypothetical protein
MAYIDGAVVVGRSYGNPGNSVIIKIKIIKLLWKIINNLLDHV